MPKDVEDGETTPLVVSADDRKYLEGLGSFRELKKRGGLETLPIVPVGGHPGNENFFVVVQVAVRLTIMLLMIGCMVWMPEQTKSLGMDRFAKHAGLAACLMVFFTTFTVGGVLNTASAGVSGCFVACLNIFFLRGFFPDGVTPGMGYTALPSIVGWLDLALFNLCVLGFNCRMGFRMTAMALNVGFMMCYLNPEDQTLISKNFKININGAAVSAFIGVSLGALSAFLAVILPYPLGWATKNMKNAGKTASEDTCKLFIAGVKYFKGQTPSVLIERQIAQTELLRQDIDGLSSNINDAYSESYNCAAQGNLRVLYEKHRSMLGEIFDILEAMQYAMSTEDFGPSHVTCMNAIGEAAHDLVDASVILLIAATDASENGVIYPDEKESLLALVKVVTKAVKTLSLAFHEERKRSGQPLSRELMNEAFFVFCISAFGRLCVDYARALREDPPKGRAFFGEVIDGMKDLFTIPMWYHFRVVSRYWLSLMLCFLFSVYMDNYVPSCAITGVFLINTRVGPDVMAMIQGLLAVVVGIVTNALMFSFPCRFGSTKILMVVATIYWLMTLTVAKGTSSLAGIGLLMAALSPFALFKFCAAQSPEAQLVSAVGLWTGIRALLIAVVITIISEIVHVPGLFTQMARDKVNEAFKAMQKAFRNVLPESGDDASNAKENIDAALAEVSGSLVDAETYNTACLMEPRGWNCKWKGQFLLETSLQLKKIRLDVLLIKKALCGLGNNMEEVVSLLNQVPEFAEMKKDLNDTMEDGRELAVALLSHDIGIFRGLDDLDTVEGLDELEGYDDTIKGMCKVVSFPDEAPDSMEDDVLVRLSIVYVMLDFLTQHVSSIIKAGVKLS